MNLAKALKVKNKLAGEVAQLRDLLSKQNVRSTKQKFDYDNSQVLANLRSKMDELVKVKAAIGAEPKINPILAWDPGRLHLFHPGGLILDPWVEVQLSSTDPAVRWGIDWLRAASGR